MYTSHRHIEQLKHDVFTSHDIFRIIQDTANTELTSTRQQFEFLNTKLAVRRQELNSEKNEHVTRYLAKQHQIVLISSVTSSGGGGSGPKRTAEPLVTHKLFMNRTALEGSETQEAFDEWYMDMTDNFELLIPGAKALMNKAENQKKIAIPPG